MAGSGVIFLLRMVPEHWILYAIILGSVLPVVALFDPLRGPSRGVERRADFRWLVFLCCCRFSSSGVGSDGAVSTATIIGITWISGFTYITPLFPLLRKGELRAGDWMRLFGSIVPPTLLLILQTQHVLRPWVVMLIMAIELSVSGLDNLLCFHRVQASAALWGARVGLITLLCALVLAGQPASLLYVALAVSVGLSAIEFYRGRRYYLEEPENAKQRVVDQPQRELDMGERKTAVTVVSGFWAVAKRRCSVGCFLIQICRKAGGAGQRPRRAGARS